MSFENIFGFIAFTTTVIGLFPQIIKTLKTKSAYDISMAMLINYVICSAAWIAYSSYVSSIFVLSSNIIGLLSSLLLVFLKINYDQKSRQHHD